MRNSLFFNLYLEQMQIFIHFFIFGEKQGNPVSIPKIKLINIHQFGVNLNEIDAPHKQWLPVDDEDELGVHKIGYVEPYVGQETNRGKNKAPANQLLHEEAVAGEQAETTAPANQLLGTG